MYLNVLLREAHYPRDQADGADGDVPRPDAELGVDAPHRLHHVLVVGQGLAHAHEHLVTHATPFSRLVA